MKLSKQRRYIIKGNNQQDELINRTTFKNKEIKNRLPTYNELYEQFESDYDRMNPMTADIAFSGWFKNRFETLKNLKQKKNKIKKKEVVEEVDESYEVDFDPAEHMMDDSSNLGSLNM